MATREYYITGDDDYNQIYGTNYEAQTFTVVTTHRIMAILLKIGENGAGNIDLEVAIQGVDVNGKPSGTDLVVNTSITAPEYEVSATTGGWVEVGFGTGTVLMAGTVYAVVLRAAGGLGDISTNWWSWENDKTSPTYTTGSRFYSANSGTTWTADTTADYMFAERDGRRIHDNHQGQITSGNPVDNVNWTSTSFIPSTNYTLYSVAVPIYRVGTPGALTIGIYAADSNHKPTGSVLATATISAAIVDALSTTNTASTWTEGTLDSPLDVVSGTKYAIVLHAADIGAGESVGWIGNANSRTDIKSVYSTNSGSTWTATSNEYYYRCYGANFTSPLSNQKVTTRIVEAVGNEIWYGSAEALVRLDDSAGEIDTSKELHMFELLGKCFIVNDTNLKVVDFVNVKITTTDLGANPPDYQTVLTGETSGAIMVVDYITALSGATTIYGKLETTATFSAETVTGHDDAGNDISFTCTAQVSGPHWYNWTVYGNSTTYGVMPSQVTLGKAWRGRASISGDSDYPQYWYKSRQGNPWDWNYLALDAQSPVASDNADAGQTGEPIVAVVPYNRDKFIYGCTNSIWFLQGDPAEGGSLFTLDDSAGFLAADAWCWDKMGDLYIVGTTGILRIPKGFAGIENITAESYPNFLKDLAYDSQIHKLVCGYDRLRDGFKICRTTLATGVNLNWWFDIQKKGLFPETYPEECGVYCLHWYEALDPTYRCLLHGCADGFVRWEDPTAVDDNIGATNEAIDSYITFGPLSLGKENNEGILNTIDAITTGSRAGTALTDSSALTCSVWTGLAPDDIVEKLKLNTSPNLVATISAPGRNRGGGIKRPVRGAYAGIRLGNNTAAQTWGLEELIINGREAGEI